MRPVNLIPPEDRRGDRAPLRRGPLAYFLVGGLGALLLAITAIVVTGNAVTEKKSELAALEERQAAVAAQAQALAPYVQFAELQASRELTVASLADSRFDWERVLRELSIVNPSDVWLTDLAAQASSDAGTAGTGSIATDPSTPSLSMTGCARDHEAVARFIAALEDIDGVTRVGLSTSVRESSGAAEGAAGTGSCATSGLPASFQAIAVFDGAAGSAASAGAGTPAAVPTSAEEPAAEIPGGENITPQTESDTGTPSKGNGKNKPQPEEALEGAQP